MPNEIKILLNEKSSLIEVMSAISSLEKTFRSADVNAAVDAKKCTFGISANITINDLSIELKRQSYIWGRIPEVITGNYRDQAGNVEMFAASGARYAVFLWFFDAILPSLGMRAEVLPYDKISGLYSSFTQELRFVLSKASKFERVFISKMHKARFGCSMRSEAAETRMLNVFNSIIDAETERFDNVIVLDTSNIICKLGAELCIDEKMYFLYKKPYKNNFLYELAYDIFMEIRGDKSYFKKLLILDCDNTLWRGIIGEDGIAGIKLSPEDFPGNIFWYAQQFFLSLQKRGVLLALCSKNNIENVDEVLLNHEFCVLKDEHIVAKKVNWKSKPDNIRELSKELNLGLDSFLFLDDSDFECEAVRAELPEVMVFQVPDKISDYPKLLKKISVFFPFDKNLPDKTQEYKLRALAKEDAAKHVTHEDYLRSLQTKIVIRRDEREKIARIAELTQKTNQFNLTTRRYSENDIIDFIESKNSHVYSFYVSDKFGDSGLIGVCIIKKLGDMAVVDTFLLSCRMIGRGVEFAAWESVINDALDYAHKIQAEYVVTLKNELVKNFFEELGFDITDQNEQGKKYEKNIKKLSEITHNSKKHFLEVSYEE
jgi:FkbH-like protein